VQERQNLMFCPVPRVWQGGIAALTERFVAPALVAKPMNRS